MNFFNISSFHSLNFSKTIGDVSTTCVYVKSLDDSSFIFLLLYVDDMLVAGNHLCDVNELKSLLSKEFDMKARVLPRRFLGWRFTWTGTPNNYGSHNMAMLRRC